MIEILHTDIGEIKAVCEYYVVNEDGTFNSLGEFVWVNEVYIAPSFRGDGILKTFAQRIIEKVPTAKFGYFWRQKKYPDEKFPGRKGIRLYHKMQWLKLLNER